MKIFLRCYIAIILIPFIISCAKEKKQSSNKNLFDKGNLVAWCVVPFDSMHRSPEQRAEMLKELGFTQFAYDWREKHLASFADEIKALKDRDIRLAAVWLWIDTDTGVIFDDANEQLLKTIKENGVKTDFWLGFSNKHFEGLTNDEKLEKAVASISYIDNRAKELGCTVSLYNHGDWFGEPLNQIKIIEKAGLKNLGIVYNFHHAHLQVKEFPHLLSEMLPYLRTVNINGMRIEGPKILPIGEGDEEESMLRTLKDSGFTGSVGILGHIETEDVKVVLKRNLDGLRSMLKSLGEEEAEATY
jgi:sugar phosphate isomerase/epimerase